MGLRQGIEEIQKSIDRASQGGNSATRWITWKDKDRKTIRFLLDADKMFTVWAHEYIDTPNGKRNFVCRKEFDAECPLCASEDPKVSYRRELGYSLALLREEVVEKDSNGRPQIVGFKDVLEEQDGKLIPVIGIVCQAPGNFWSYVSAIHQKYGSLLEYDIEIQRKGAGTDTLYPMFANPPVKIENMETKYQDYMMDLGGYLQNIGSQEYYTKTLGTGPTSNGTIQSESPTTPLLSEETEFDRLRRLHRGE